MPKMKTKRGASKRFSVTASGKVRHRKKNRSHILTKKDQKRKRQLRKASYLEDRAAKNAKRMILAK